MARVRWAQWPLRGSPWALKYPYCHQMITQTQPRGNIRVRKRSKCENFFRFHKIAYTTTILGLSEGPWHGLHRPSGHYMATGGHIAYMHAFSVKLVIASLRQGRVIFFIFAVNACRKKSSHCVIF